MAEFKLGRIKFVYQGNWITNHAYQVDDVITNGGKTYICVISHTSAVAFDTDFSSPPAKWNLVADGTQWRGNWTAGAYYNAGDQVLWGSVVYACKTPHTAGTYTSPDFLGLEANLSDWDVFAASFGWMGAWATGTRYKLRDVVFYGGITYVCNTHHISAATVGDGLEIDLEKWDTFNEGLNFVGDWAGAGERYKLNDIVKYGADLWICTTQHTSDTSFDLTKFSIFVNGFQFESSWDNATVYQIGDMVTYGGYTFTALQNNTGKTPTAEPAFWAAFSTGFSFQGDWLLSTSYKVGSVVRMGGYTYVATKDNAVFTVTATATSVSTDLLTPNQIACNSTSGFVPGLPIVFSGTTFGNIVAGTTYYVYEVTNLTHFKISATQFGGVFDLASATGTMTGTTNPTPPFTGYWTRLNSGIRYNATNATYTNVSGTNIIGTGSSATFDVVRANSVYSVTLNATGSGYAVNNTLKILGTSLGGVSPANDLTITITGVNSGAITLFTSVGNSVTWTSGTAYVLGDAVFFGANSYICVSAHVGTSGNRPDADATGTYWNLLAAGAASATLTTQGDTYYYGANGPTRLPIGTDGQVLRATNGFPAWSYYGAINNIVYVALNGSDTVGNGQGTTIDKPWKTVRFAAKQVEDGYLNTNATALIAKNKQFLMKEITNWVVYTYTVSISAAVASTASFTTTSTANLTSGMPIKFSGTVGGVTAGVTYYVLNVLSSTSFTITNLRGGVVAVALSDQTAAMTGTLSYDSTLCERDVGLLVDAVAFDLGHGGTQQITAAAQAYYANGAFVTTAFGYETVQSVAAYTYLGTLIGKVLGNVAPAANYQTLNGVAAAVQATQIIDPTLTAESGTAAAAVGLLAIVNNGITAGVATAIPSAIQPATTINVKTGTYNETLPIVVPKNTAIVGDELRGSIVQPSTSNTGLVTDKAKSLSALNRVKSLIPAIVSNTAVVPTSGNTATQSYLFTSNRNAATVTVANNVTTMTNIIGTGLSAVPAFTITDPAGYDTGYFNARRLVVANKAFIQAEIAAYMAANQAATWNGLSADQKAACTRDIGYIVDALQYDLTYGGNLATVIAARAYYSNGTFVELAGEKTAALAAQTYLKGFIDNIVLATNGWGQISGGTQDRSGTAGSSAAATFAQARVQEMYDTINTGVEPTTIAPSTAWVSSTLTTAYSTFQAQKSYIQSNVIGWITSTYPGLFFNQVTCSRDVGYIIDALGYDMMFGSNFLSVWSAMSYYRALTSTGVVLASQLQPTLGTVAVIGSSLKEITSGVSSTTGSFIAKASVQANANLMYDIINNGNTEVPAFVLPAPTGYNTSYLVGYGDAKALIIGNYQFLKDEISAYLNTNFNSVWTALGATGQANCQRDVGYILDSLQYDLTYGGNLQTLVTGRAYYSYSQLVVAASEKAATIAAYGRLKTVIDYVITKNTSWTKSTGNVTSQYVTGTAGSAGSSTFAQARVQDIVDWVTNGVSPASTAPSITWASADLQLAFAALQSKKSEIQADTVVWVQKFFQSMNFTFATCSRDTGYIVDALSYDLVFGSNFNSIKSGMSYNRAIASTIVVLTSEKAASLGAIKFIKYKAKQIASTGAVAQISSAFDDITSTIAGGATPRLLWPDFTGVDPENALGAKLIWQNKAFIQAEVIQYISTNYPAVVYDKTICARDVGYIIDALRYDLTYGGNYATRNAALAYYSGATLEIAAGEKAATIAAYGQLKTAVQAIGQGGVYSALQTSVARVTGLAGDATTASTVGTLVDAVTTTINNVANVPAESLASTSWVDSGLTTQNTALQSAKSTIQTNVINYINTTYPTLSYDSTTCSRDVGYIIDAIGYDFMFGSNFRSVNAGRSYYRAQASKVVGAQKTATIAAFNYLQTQIATIVTNNATALARANANMVTVIAILTNGVGETPEVHGTNTYNNNLAVIKGAELLRANSSFLAAEASAWTTYNYTSTVTTTASSTNLVTTSAAHNLVVGDAVRVSANSASTTATATDSGTNRITLTSTTGIVTGMPITFGGSGFGGLLTGTTYYVLTVGVGYVTISTTYNGSVFTPTSTTTGTMTAAVGGLFGSLAASTTYYVLTVPSTTTLTLTATQNGVNPALLTSGNGVASISYYYSVASCIRDTKAIIDAIVYDINFPGNYKSLRAATIYNNAVNGSLASDMFYVRNGTGVRNMTLSGLSGTLTIANSYGTKRPTAGAYVSLDPGYGPNDKNVWITTKSCYVQNVTNFGTGCVGMKIDGALHSAGNKSIVANDFTQVLSDGIGVWCTGTNSLTELVSVFSYYNYSGYLAELGGKIRATNGNSSYGTYGVVAEGVDTYETAIYGTVNNRYFQAQIAQVITDAANKVLRFEYGNAGTGYTNTVHGISGSGFNAATIADEFRDNAVNETRLIDLNDTNGVGGTSYVSITNAAQTGDKVSLTIAATDTALSNAYNGMRVQLTAGSGVGQFANILTYNSGTKVAQVYKDSFATVTITSTAITNGLLTVASTGSLYVGMPIYLGATANGLTANTLYYIIAANFSTTQFAVSTALGGGAVSISTTGSVSIPLYAAGWDHVIPGTASLSTLDVTSTYIIEPRINYAAPGYTATARTLSATGTWVTPWYAAGKYVAISSGSTASSYSSDGKTWASAGALSASTTWQDIVYGGGEGATATAVVGGLGGSGATLSVTMGSGLTANQVVGVTILSGGSGYTTPPTIVFTPVGAGSGAAAICTVLNGAVVSVTVTIPGSGYSTGVTATVATDRITSIKVNTWGKNYGSAPTVTVSGGGSSNQATATAIMTNGGVSSITVGNNGGTGYTSQPTVTILDSTAKFVAIATGAVNNCYQTVSGLGTAWTAGNSTGKTTLASLTFGNGVYVAVGGTADAVSSTDGITWVSRTIPTLGAGTYSSVQYGNGVYVAVSTGNLATAISTNGVSWIAGGNLPANTTWTSITYGNGRFVAIASGGKSAAYSLDQGVTWIASPAGLPTTQTWTHVEYGQGLFFAVATGTQACATSPDGVTWTAQAMPVSSNWTGIVFGNAGSNPLWVATSSTSGTIAASIRTGATAQGRIKSVNGVLTEVRMIEPGSGYPKGSVSATTTSTNLITVDNTTNLVDSQPIEFFDVSSGGLTVNTTYYVIGSTITSTQFKVSTTAGSATAVTLSSTTPVGMTYRAGPILTQTDPNRVKIAAMRVRLGDGALGNPSFSSRGTNNTTATASTAGDGYSDLYQNTTFINVAGLYSIPTAGANIQFGSISNTWFKLVATTNVLGIAGNYTCQFQISPSLTTYNAPSHGDTITTRLKYSQVRLTGHDFLYIGTGNFTQTNYPNVNISTAIQANQTLSSGGGRTFFTSTDQDGNFNVGNLFGVQQATGTATLNASAFNLAGLQSLTLGAVSLGVGSATVTQFSTDPYFTANSDNVVPTQKAIKSYITAQIGGGAGSLNVNTLTAGVVYIAGNTISNTTGNQILVTSKMNFTGGIDGAPVALGFFMQK